MQDTLQTLLGLQEIDRDIFRVERELKRLPAELAVQQAKLDQRRARIAELARQSEELRERIKEIESRTRIQRQRIRKVDQEAAGARADMALQVAFQHEARTLKREISSAEEEALVQLERVETLDTEAGGLRGELEQAEEVFREYSQNIENEIGEARASLETMTAARTSRLSNDVPEQALVMYGRLLQAREGEAMAELDGRICQACFMEIPTNLVVRLMRGSELIQCPSCDRILFART